MESEQSLVILIVLKMSSFAPMGLFYGFTYDVFIG